MTIREAVALPPERNEQWELARQTGLTAAASRLPAGEFWRGTETEAGQREAAAWGFEPLLHLKQRFADAGLDLVAIEDVYPPLDDVRLGTDRERGVERFCRLVENVGAVGVPVLCYTWSAAFNWLRTSTTVPARGGSLVSAYDHELLRDAPPPAAGTVSEAELWENLEYFLDRVVPVAEEAGVRLALHPDDPPVSPVRGVSRILTSPSAVERALSLHSSDHHGLTFCQGTFATMGADVPAAIRRFADDIRYVHFRDVEGTPERFTETWHDAGPTDMLEAVRTYRDVGFDGPMRPDHVPTMAGESNDSPGYHAKGRLFAIGYLRGLLERTRGE